MSTLTKNGAEKARRWIITLPAGHYPEDEVERKLQKYDLVRGQLEEGEDIQEGKDHGYLHWQLYLEHKNAIAFSTLRNLFPKGHFEPAREARAAGIAYCMKQDTSKGVFIEIGAYDPEVRQGSRSDLKRLHEQVLMGVSVDDLVLSDATAAQMERALRTTALARDRKIYGGSRRRELEVHYIHGDSGVGKTSSIMETFDDVFVVSDWRSWPFNGYRGQDVLVMDEYRSSLEIAWVLRVLDRYALELPVKNGGEMAKFTKVFMTSNLAFEDQHRRLFEKDNKVAAAFRRRFTSISEMKTGGELVAEKGDPPRLVVPDFLLAA